MSTAQEVQTRLITNDDKRGPETAAQSAVSSSVGVPLMLLGPALTALVMISHAHAQVFSPPGALGYSLAAALVVWNPFGKSLPGAILLEARDSALPEWGASNTWNPANLVRLVVMPFYLATSRYSATRAQSTAALVGWLSACALVAAHFM